MSDAKVIAIMHDAVHPENDKRYLEELETLLELYRAIAHMVDLKNQSDCLGRALQFSKLNVRKLRAKVLNASIYYTGYMANMEEMCKSLVEWTHDELGSEEDTAND